MRFKAGDKVLVRKDLNENFRYNSVSVSDDMVLDFAGSIVTIKKMIGTEKYAIEEDKGRWTWTTNMLVELHDTVIESKHSISKIPGYGTVITLEDGTRIYQSKEGYVVQLSTNSTLS